MSNFLTANYHAHTFRCQHAVGNERDYIEAAIKMGIKEFGFSDHIPCPFRDGYISHIRMTMDEAPEYVKTIRALADEYQNDIPEEPAEYKSDPHRTESHLPHNFHKMEKIP